MKSTAKRADQEIATFSIRHRLIITLFVSAALISLTVVLVLVLATIFHPFPLGTEGTIVLAVWISVGVAITLAILGGGLLVFEPRYFHRH